MKILGVAAGNMSEMKSHEAEISFCHQRLLLLQLPYSKNADSNNGASAKLFCDPTEMERDMEVLPLVSRFMSDHVFGTVQLGSIGRLSNNVMHADLWVGF